jgi:hypothetical protein
VVKDRDSRCFIGLYTHDTKVSLGVRNLQRLQTRLTVVCEARHGLTGAGPYSSGPPEDMTSGWAPGWIEFQRKKSRSHRLGASRRRFPFRAWERRRPVSNLDMNRQETPR